MIISLIFDLFTFDLQKTYSQYPNLFTLQIIAKFVIYLASLKFLLEYKSSAYITVTFFSLAFLLWGMRGNTDNILNNANNFMYVLAFKAFLMISLTILGHFMIKRIDPNDPSVKKSFRLTK